MPGMARHYDVGIDDGTGVRRAMGDRNPSGWHKREQLSQRVLNGARRVVGQTMDNVGKQLETH